MSRKADVHIPHGSTDGTINADAVTTAMIADEAVTLAKLADLTRGSIISGQTANNRPTALVAKTSGQILVGDGNDLASVAVSGDITLAANGAATIAANAVEASMLAANLARGFIPLDITGLREIAADAVQNLAAHGGILASDSTPTLTRVNGATDKALRVTWAATVVDEAQFAPVPMPPDLDDAADVTVHLLMAMGGATDTPTVDVQAFDAVGDTEMGGNTAAVTGTTIAEYTVTLAAANIAGHPLGFLNISLVPAAHANDALYLYAAWIEYARKS